LNGGFNETEPDTIAEIQREILTALTKITRKRRIIQKRFKEF